MFTEVNLCYVKSHNVSVLSDSFWLVEMFESLPLSVELLSRTRSPDASPFSIHLWDSSGFQGCGHQLLSVFGPRGTITVALQLDSKQCSLPKSRSLKNIHVYNDYLYLLVIYWTHRKTQWLNVLLSQLFCWRTAWPGDLLGLPKARGFGKLIGWPEAYWWHFIYHPRPSDRESQRFRVDLQDDQHFIRPMHMCSSFRECSLVLECARIC